MTNPVSDEETHMKCSAMNYYSCRLMIRQNYSMRRTKSSRQREIFCCLNQLQTQSSTQSGYADIVLQSVYICEHHSIVSDDTKWNHGSNSEEFIWTASNSGDCLGF
nr:unnamed protein product [Spirometra erinaceieuropaei]